MRRDDLAALIAARLDERHVVICGLGSTMFAWAATATTAPTYYPTDAMGLSPGLALGFALATPTREVVLLAGDGDLIMNLGVLLTVVGAAPTNLRTVVFNNRRYETGGGQPIPASGALRLGAIAQAVGFAWARECDPDASTEEVCSAVDELMAVPAPGLLVVGVDAEPALYGGAGERSGVEHRIDFQRRLCVGQHSHDS